MWTPSGCTWALQKVLVKLEDTSRSGSDGASRKDMEVEELSRLLLKTKNKSYSWFTFARPQDEQHTFKNLSIGLSKMYHPFAVYRSHLASSHAKGVRPMSLQPIDLDEDASKWGLRRAGRPSKMEEQKSQNSQLETMHSESSQALLQQAPDTRFAPATCCWVVTADLSTHVQIYRFYGFSF